MRTVRSYEQIFVEEVVYYPYKLIASNWVEEPDKRVCYAAVEHPKGYTFALVTLFIKHNDGDTAWKEMDESMGPCYYDIRKDVYDHLTEIPNQGTYSEDWRKEVERILKINKKQLTIKL